jgi:hypothetical protein
MDALIASVSVAEVAGASFLKLMLKVRLKDIESGRKVVEDGLLGARDGE